MTFKFFRENKIDQEYELSSDDLKSQFENYLKSLPKDKLQIGYYMSLLNFIGTPEGLNSVAEDKQMIKIDELLFDTYKSIKGSE
tara:strand:+ start:927 stop:1178 length:252 start_codon:yes stop_codon:yes gene_type:complete